MVLDPAATADGWLTRSVLDPGSCERLRRAHDALNLPPDHAFYASSAHGSRAVARGVDQMLKRELGPRLRELLPDHDPFLAAFISKGGSQGSHVGFHQDWTYTDERVHRTILVWIPLVDTTAANGGMRAVPGSHHWTTGLRASGAEHATEPLQAALAAQAVPIDLGAGTGLVYDAALVHGSTPNPTALGRPAAAIALAPTGCELVHFHVDDAGGLGGWSIDESYYTMQPYASAPTGSEPIEPWDRLVSTDDFVPHLAATSATSTAT